MIVLDSSALIHLLSGTDQGKTIRQSLGPEAMAATSISVHEVLIGTKEKEKALVEDFFKGITIIPFDAEASYMSIQVQSGLRRKGKMLAKLDLFIASICVLHNLKLFTTDSDFKSVDGLVVSVY